MFDALVIDNTEFARQGGHLSGQVEIAALSRLGDVLADAGGCLAFNVTGHLDAHGRPALKCVVSGKLSLICQRCLQSVNWPVDLVSDLVIDPADSQAAEGMDDGPDGIDADPQMDVRALIEDELLLALPLSPRHDPGQCRLELPVAGRSDDRSVLAGLGHLVQQRNDNDTKE